MLSIMSIHWYWLCALPLVAVPIYHILRGSSLEWASYSSKWRDYQVKHWMDTGDASDIVAAASGRLKNADCLIKVPRTTGVQPWLQHERNVLADLYEKLDDRVLSSLPMLVDECECPAGKGSVFSLDRSFKSVQRLFDEQRAGLDESDIIWIFEKTLTLLDHVHRAGWVHGAVLPSHLIVNLRHKSVQLIDWKHAVEKGQPLVLASTKFLSWYPDPDSSVLIGDAMIDISLTAKTLFTMGERRIQYAGVPHGLRTLLLRCADRNLPGDVTAKDVVRELKALQQQTSLSRKRRGNLIRKKLFS